MSSPEIEARVLKVLTEVAPNVDAGDVDPKVNFRDQFDFDSMDFLNFSIALAKEFGVEIADVDYPRLASLEGCVTYMAELTKGPA